MSDATTTIRQIARIAGVSRSTVSRVLNDSDSVNEETREHVKRVMAEYGYKPNVHAQSLASKRVTTIGIVVAEMLDPFFATMTAGIEEVSKDRGVQILLGVGGTNEESERDAIEYLLAQGCDAIVTHAKFLPDAALTAYAERLPGMIFLNRQVDVIEERCVWLDNRYGGELAASHLVDQGHRSIAMVTSDYEIDDARLRLAGAQSALKARNVELPEHCVESAKPDRDGGESAVRALLSRGADFSAVLCYNDMMAIGAIHALDENGYAVPGDIAVVGFDDLPVANFCIPRLTTVRYPIAEMAKTAANLALDRAAQVRAGAVVNNLAPMAYQRTFKPAVVIRESA